MIATAEDGKAVMMKKLRIYISIYSCLAEGLIFSAVVIIVVFITDLNMGVSPLEMRLTGLRSIL